MQYWLEVQPSQLSKDRLHKPSTHRGPQGIQSTANHGLIVQRTILPNRPGLLRKMSFAFPGWNICSHPVAKQRTRSNNPALLLICHPCQGKNCIHTWKTAILPCKLPQNNVGRHSWRTPAKYSESWLKDNTGTEPALKYLKVKTTIFYFILMYGK